MKQANVRFNCHDYLAGPPDLVIEILSPGTRGRDLEIKRKLYARFGVRKYWIADPEEKSIEVLTWSDAGCRAATVVPQTGILNSPLFPALNLSLADIFLEIPKTSRKAKGPRKNNFTRRCRLSGLRVYGDGKV